MNLRLLSVTARIGRLYIQSLLSPRPPSLVVRSHQFSLYTGESTGLLVLSTFHHDDNMFPTAWTQSSSDPPSPTLTAVDIGSPRLSISDAALKEANLHDGLAQDPEPLDLEANRPAPEKGQRANDTIKVENQHLELAHPDVSDALRDAGVALVDRGDDGKLYIRSNVDDPDNPRNWPKWKRYMVAGIASWLTIIVRLFPLHHHSAVDDRRHRSAQWHRVTALERKR